MLTAVVTGGAQIEIRFVRAEEGEGEHSDCEFPPDEEEGEGAKWGAACPTPNEAGCDAGAVGTPDMGRPSATATKASTISLADWKRRAGSFASALVKNASASGESPVAMSEGTG